MHVSVFDLIVNAQKEGGMMRAENIGIGESMHKDALPERMSLPNRASFEIRSCRLYYNQMRM